MKRFFCVVIAFFMFRKFLECIFYYNCKTSHWKNGASYEPAGEKNGLLEENGKWQIASTDAPRRLL